jgi:hypothetical protein
MEKSIWTSGISQIELKRFIEIKGSEKYRKNISIWFPKQSSNWVQQMVFYRSLQKTITTCDTCLAIPAQIFSNHKLKYYQTLKC